VPHRVESAAEVATVHRNRVRPDTGILLAVPIPEADELDPAALAAAVDAALSDAEVAGMTGPSVTPFVLAGIAAATEGRSVPANLALAEHNAGVAAAIAAAVAASGT
jgi:pseudouridine-5'-phosphate glycosidase